MQYEGPFSLLTIAIVLILAIQWTLIASLPLAVLAIATKTSRSILWGILAVMFVIILIVSWVGVHQCNTGNQCPLDAVPTLIL